MRKSICFILTVLLLSTFVAGCAPSGADSSSFQEPMESSGTQTGAALDFTDWDFSSIHTDWFLSVSEDEYSDALSMENDLKRYDMEDAPRELAAVLRPVGRYHSGLYGCEYPTGIYEAKPSEPGIAYAPDYWLAFAYAGLEEMDEYPIDESVTYFARIIPEEDVRQMAEEHIEVLEKY